MSPALAGGFSTPDHQGSPTTFFFTHCASVTFVPSCSLTTPCQSLCVCCFFCMKYRSPLSLCLFLGLSLFSTFMSQLKFPLCGKVPPPPLTLYLKLLFYYLFISLENVPHCVAIMVICLFAYHHSLPASRGQRSPLVTLWLCALCLEQCPRHGNLSTDITEWIFINE